MNIEGRDFSIDKNQLLLKGADLANTDWIVAVCCYTGDNTKIMQNSQKGRVKMSNLEGRINKLVIYIVLI